MGGVTNLVGVMANFAAEAAAFLHACAAARVDWHCHSALKLRAASDLQLT